MAETRRVLIVTGGSRGIGAATARLAGARGYAVCVNYASRPDAAEDTCAAITQAGGTAFSFRADCSREQEVAALFDEAEERFGAVSDLVTCAGMMGGPTRLEALPAEEMRRLFEINVFATLLCCREAVRRMSTRNGGAGGRIVTISSVAAANGSIGERVHYAASKGAINSFSFGLSREVAGEGVRVNTFSPGLTATEMNPPERLARLGPTIPIGRVGEAQEMAQGILWLLSDEAAYCVGANIVMSGGR